MSQKKLTDKELYVEVNRLLAELTELILKQTQRDIDEGNFHPRIDGEMPPDMSCECSMCGKPMFCNERGMCSTCWQVWNG